MSNRYFPVLFPITKPQILTPQDTHYCVSSKYTYNMYVLGILACTHVIPIMSRIKSVWVYFSKCTPIYNNIIYSHVYIHEPVASIQRKHGHMHTSSSRGFSMVLDPAKTRTCHNGAPPGINSDTRQAYPCVLCTAKYLIGHTSCVLY